ncbi:hypothetical protein Taro_002614, partial [Colocasia esculenta]|nr:hypothetical protein [Colocasia esculenta]
KRQWRKASPAALQTNVAPCVSAAKRRPAVWERCEEDTRVAVWVRCEEDTRVALLAKKGVQQFVHQASLD